MNISPYYGMTSFVIKLNIVDLPVPESPANAIVYPDLISKLKFL